MRYFYCPPTCSLAAMVALELAGAAYEAVEIDPRGDRAELLAVNPEGKVPVLEVEGTVITDTVAILYWLARRFPEAALIPADDTGTALALSRIAWFGNVFQITRRRLVRPQMFAPDTDAQQAIRLAATNEYAAALTKVDGWMAEPDCPLAVQACALLFYHWAVRDDQPVDHLRAYGAVVERLVARDDVQRALVRHASPLLQT